MYARTLSGINIHQLSKIVKYIYIYQYFQDRCKLCPHCYQMSNPPKYRSLIPAVWVWKYGTGSVILPVKICQVPEQKNMGLSENRVFPQNPMVHHGLSISKIKTLGEFSTHFHPFSSIFITMVIFWGILKKKMPMCGWPMMTKYHGKTHRETGTCISVFTKPGGAAVNVWVNSCGAPTPCAAWPAAVRGAAPWDRSCRLPWSGGMWESNVKHA